MNLFNKPLNQLTVEDIRNLISNQTAESRVLDYKSNNPLTPIPDKDHKIEFAKDISAFANTAGGYLIYGVEEQDTIPIAADGFEIKNNDVDNFKATIENILSSKLERRLYGLEYQPIPLPNGKYLFVIHIPKSLCRPHAVKMKDDKTSKIYCFMGRNAVTNYPYDVTEIRDSFIQQDRSITQMQLFRENRIHKIYTEETPIPMTKGAKIILHLLPITAFDIQQYHNVECFFSDYQNHLNPIGGDYFTMQRQRNFDGILALSGNIEFYCPSYVQLYRNGIIEAVNSYYLPNTTDLNTQSKNSFISPEYEEIVVDATKKYLNTLKRLEIVPPIYIALTLVGVKGYTIATSYEMPNDNHLRQKIDRDILLLPENEITDLSQAPQEILKTSFDLVWNACGLDGSKNYSKKGLWLSQKLTDQSTA